MPAPFTTQLVKACTLLVIATLVYWTTDGWVMLLKRFLHPGEMSNWGIFAYSLLGSILAILWALFWNEIGMLAAATPPKFRTLEIDDD